MVILKFIFFIFLIGFVAVIWMGWKFFRRIHATTKKFRQHMGYDAAANRPRTYGNQEGVVDQRNPNKANRKIIPRDEGEYVDFKEEKS